MHFKLFLVIIIAGSVGEGARSEVSIMVKKKGLLHILVFEDVLMIYDMFEEQI